MNPYNPAQALHVWELLKPLDLSECNGNYQWLITQRLTGMAALLGKPIEQLTLAQALECIEHAGTEWNSLATESRQLELEINQRLKERAA